MSRSATAGNSMGRYSFEVPSARMAPVTTTTSPPMTSRLMPPQVPMRMKLFTPSRCSSSMQMAAEGPPMPVEQTMTFTPSKKPS